MNDSRQNGTMNGPAGIGAMNNDPGGIEPTSSDPGALVRATPPRHQRNEQEITAFDGGTDEKREARRTNNQGRGNSVTPGGWTGVGDGVGRGTGGPGMY